MSAVKTVILAFAAFAASTAAAPQGVSEGIKGLPHGIKGLTVAQALNSCNGQSHLSCCSSDDNSVNVNKRGGIPLVGDILEDLNLVGQCNQLNIAVAVLGDAENEDIQGQCQGQQVACCAGKEGEKSIACSPLVG